MELEAAVAGLTDAAGLEQLLAWHWDLLVATAGTEHVTAVPAGRHTHRSLLDSHTQPLYTYSYHASPPLHLHQGLFFVQGKLS